MSDKPTPLIQIRFDGPPSHTSGHFIEVEDASGASIRVGEWRQDGNDWLLVMPDPRQPHFTPTELRKALVVLEEEIALPWPSSDSVRRERLAKVVLPILRRALGGEPAEPPISSCILHRCVEHRHTPQLNATIVGGVECGACGIVPDAPEADDESPVIPLRDLTATPYTGADDV